MPKYVMPPRQKMINLIYIILIAMLGINVSQDTLEGYDLISNGYQSQTNLLQVHNANFQKVFENEKPERKNLALQIKEKTNIMRLKLVELKRRITQAADKDKYQEGKLINRNNTDVTPNIMLNLGQAKKLKQDIESYKKQMSIFIGSSEEPVFLNSYLNITPQKKNVSWEVETFSNLTANAGVAVLNKLEEELLTYEKEMLLILSNQEEQVLQEAETEDTLIGKDKIYINGQPMEVLPGGTIQMPIVQISSESGSVLYRDMENKLKCVSIGIAGSDLKLSMEEGKIIQRDGEYWALPDKGAQTASIVVSKKNDIIAHFDYIVKELPEPMPYIVYTEQGKQQFYKGNVPLDRRKLHAITELAVVAPEGPKVNYKILSFETVFIKSGGDDIITLTNQGNKFSDEQRKIINLLQPGDKFYITSIVVSGGHKNKEQIASINIVLI